MNRLNNRYYSSYYFCYFGKGLAGCGILDDCVF